MNATLKTTILRAQNLGCPSCVPKIERELYRLDGVDKAEVHFTTGRIVVLHDPDKAGPDDLIRAVKHAGYTAKVGRN
jgi:copper chaperone CopZ